jgi:hypothetical protein
MTRNSNVPDTQLSDIAVIVTDPLPAAGVMPRPGASHCSLGDERRSGVQFAPTPPSPMRYVPTPALGGAQILKVAVDWQSEPTNSTWRPEIRLTLRPFADATNEAPSTVHAMRSARPDGDVGPPLPHAIASIAITTRPHCRMRAPFPCAFGHGRGCAGRLRVTAHRHASRGTGSSEAAGLRAPRLAKLARNTDRDREDVLSLARGPGLALSASGPATGTSCGPHRAGRTART